MRTPSQTVGPFFEFGLCDRPANEMDGGDVRVRGRVLDGAGEPVNDALVEIWNPQGGFGRCGTDVEGRFELLVRRVPHYEVMVFARGLLKPVLTRMYLPGETGAEDPTMVAQREEDGLRFDVHLAETAFFEL
jgi:protocatechuate 3,4-dioxygenase alpha subunit